MMKKLTLWKGSEFCARATSRLSTSTPTFAFTTDEPETVIKDNPFVS
jgi:hypothetical protein